MTNEKYAKAYKEIVEILKYMPKESVNKIPSKMLEMFNEEYMQRIGERKV